jgi:hypothetical protein
MDDDDDDEEEEEEDDNDWIHAVFCLIFWEKLCCIHFDKSVWS